MSTKQAKKKRAYRRVERMKIIEYAVIGLVFALFIVMAVIYGSGGTQRQGESDPQATATSEPTVDPSIRGMHIFAALEDADLSVVQSDGGYCVTSTNGVPFDMYMTSDDHGIVSLTFETLYCPDPVGEGAVHDALREKNRESEAAMRELFGLILPVFGRPVSEAETIVNNCTKVVQSGQTYTKRFGTYTLRIVSDPEASPQSVGISFVRDD